MVVPYPFESLVFGKESVKESSEPALKGSEPASLRRFEYVLATETTVLSLANELVLLSPTKCGCASLGANPALSSSSSMRQAEQAPDVLQCAILARDYPQVDVFEC